MDDIKNAAKKRFERKLNESDWEVHIGGQPDNAVNVWLYSVSPTQGVRQITQLSIEGYRLAKTPGLSPELKGVNAWDVLGSFFDGYDKLEDRDQQLAQSSHLSAVLLNYASHTATWAALPPPGKTPGIHFIVFDWSTASVERVFKPAAVITSKVLSREDLAGIYRNVLDAHLAKHPTEGPI